MSDLYPVGDTQLRILKRLADEGPLKRSAFVDDLTKDQVNGAVRRLIERRLVVVRADRKIAITALGRRRL